MSANRPKSSIFLTDEPKIAENKIKNAYTGGSPLPNFQKKHGGVPGICPIYYLRTYHFEEDKKVEKECNSGEILCGDCKNIAAKQVSNFLTSHQERLNDANERIEEFTLKTPIRSILK
jgi:tryptophanyl-tRNA synthetase